jgi:6-phosphogluconolactonase
MNWGKTYIFWSDERFVDHEDDNSNYKLAYEQFLSKASIRESHIFPIPVNGTPAEAAELYEEQIRSFFKERMLYSLNTTPMFDIVLLGMGGDGHTASLFPKSSALDEKQKLVVAVKAPTYAPSRDRISFTFNLINNAKDILMLIPGKEKQKLIKQLVSGGKNIKIPAQMVRNTDNTYLLVDNDYS